MALRRAAFAAFAAMLVAPVAVGQETPEPGFAVGVALCRDAMVARVPLTELQTTQTALRPASAEIQAAHRLGSLGPLWLLAGRDDAEVVVVQPNDKGCNVYMTGAALDDVFAEASAVMIENGAFAEGEPTQRRGQGVQRNFRTSDGNARAELQTFGEGDDLIAMALFGRRR